jgi:polyhydroxyalkanoate synthesis regulator phasin
VSWPAARVPGEAAKPETAAGVMPLQASSNPLSSPTETALLQEDAGIKVQTLGANGATELLSNQLDTLAVQLVKQGQMTPAQITLLSDLANQGHRLAHIQSLVENAVQETGGDPQKMRQLSLDVNGVKKSAAEWTAEIGFNTGIESAELLVQGKKSRPDPEMITFLNAYRDVRKDATLFQNPAVRSTVENAVLQIASISESFEDTVQNLLFQNLRVRDKETLNRQVASNASHMNSAKICLAGDFVDAGITCVE